MKIRDWLTGGPPLFRSALLRPEAAPERKAQYLDGYQVAFPSRMLVHGPGASDPLPRTGDGNSAVFACLAAIAEGYIEAPLRVWRQPAPGQRSPLPRHPLQALLDNPNPFMSALEIWAWVQWAKHLDGNAYLRKLRSGGRSGNVVELWPLSPTRVQVLGSATEFIGRYRFEYAPGKYQDYAPEDILHFRLGLDDRNHRLGMAPMKRLLRAITTDDRAAAWTDRLLQNGAVMSMVITTEQELTPAQAEEIKGRAEALYSGEHLGRVGVLGKGASAEQMGFSPEQMLLKELHHIPESRIAAVLRVPPIVAGLGVGLDACLTGEMRVWTVDGPKRMDAMQAGDLVWSFVEGRLEPRRVTRAWQTGTRPVFRLRTKNRTIRATGNHPFLVRVPGTMRGGSNAERRVRYGWARLDRLAVGAQVVQAKALPARAGTTLPDGRPATADMLRFFGAIMGDGTVTPGRGLVMAIPQEDRCAAAYRARAGALFRRYAGGGVRPWKRAQDGRTAQIVALRDAGASYGAIERAVGLTKASVRDRYQHATAPKPVATAPVAVAEVRNGFCVNAAADSHWLASLGLSGRALSKRVPTWVYGLSRALQLAFLAGLVDSDGYIDARGALTWTFANEALLHDVRMLCVGLGIQCCNVSRQDYTAAVLPNPGRRERYSVWRCVASSAVQVAEIPFTDPLYRARVDANAGRVKADGGDAAKAGLDGGLGFYQVCAIKPDGVAPVYDLEVEGGHSFVAEGLVVHNSTYSNYGQARAAFAESTLSSLWAQDQAKLQQQLVPEFTSDRNIIIAHDLSDIRSFQTDETQKSQRLHQSVGGPWMTPNEARAEAGMLPLPDGQGDVLFVPVNVVATPVEDLKGAGGPQDAPAPADPAEPPVPLRAVAARKHRRGIAPDDIAAAAAYWADDPAVGAFLGATRTGTES